MIIMKYAISACYSAGTVGFVDFPEGKTWDDVRDWYVKWDILHVSFKGTDEWVEFSLDSDNDDTIDWKRPISVSVSPTDENGDADYNEVLDDA
jgi:hypothetical protein